MTALGCADGVDNDGDGFIDTECSVTTTTSCRVDTDCPGAETCNADPDCLVEMYCQDGIDNDGDGSIDIADTDCQCLDDVFNAGNCTANDVKFVTIGLGVQDDGCVSSSDTVTIFLGADLETTATTRYDIGMWIDLNGGNARGSTCSLTTSTSCMSDADCPMGEICAGICNRMILQPTAGTTHDPFHGFCSVNTTTACSASADCPLFDPNEDPPGEICEISSFRLEDTDKCGELSKTDPGFCSTTTTMTCDADADCPGVETCSIFSPTKHADFIWPFAITVPCTENATPDGFVGLSRCATWSNSAGGIDCNSVADAGPETTSKCRCEDVPPTNIPLPQLSTTCNCDSPTTVAPGFPVTCTVSYANLGGRCSVTTTMACDADADCPGAETCSCIPDPATPERFQCGTAGYLRFDVDDGAATGTQSGVCIDTGSCSVTAATSCTVDADCPALETCVDKGWCSTTTSTSCATDSDCPGVETCVAPTCDADADCPGAIVCSVDGDLGSVETVGGNCSVTTATECTLDSDCPGAEICEISGGLHWTPESSASSSLGVVGPADSESLTFAYTVDPSAGDGGITLSFTPTWVNSGTCSTTTTTTCQSDADCPGIETCVPDYTLNPRSQTVIESTCAINVAATQVTIAGLRAYDVGGLVEVEWETVAEVGTRGFHLWRFDEVAATWERVNDRLLPATQNLPGGLYRLVDPAASPYESLVYKVVEVDSRGTHHGSRPVRVEVEPASGPATTGFTANPKTPSAEMRARWAAAQEAGQATAAKGSGPERAPKSQRLKIIVEESDLYFVDASAVAEGLGQPLPRTRAALRAGRLRLSSQGAEIAWLAAADGAGLFFLGSALDSLFSRENVYWLEPGRGRQIETQGGRPPSPVDGALSFRDAVHFETDQLPRPHVASDPLEDYWFWDFVLSGDPVLGEKSFEIEVHGSASTEVAATLTMDFHGLSDPLGSGRHRAEIRINGTAIGEVLGLGNGSQQGTVSFAQSLLVEGINSVEVVGLEGDFFVDSFDLRYQRLFRASADRLELRGDINPTVTVEGFSDADIVVYQVSVPQEPVRVDARLVDRGEDGSYRVSFRPASPTTPYLVTTESQARGVESLAAVGPTSLRDPRTEAEYVVIAPAPLLSSADALAEFRRGTGLQTLVVDLEDIYNTFNHGLSDPRAIKAFLAYAHDHWAQRPRYVALAGKGSYDYRDVFGLGANLIPPIMAATPNGLVAADSAYGDVKGSDSIPEIAVGRIPVVTGAELLAYLEKVVARERSDGEWMQQVLMMADNPDGAGDFPQDSDDLALLLPNEATVRKVYLASPDSVEQARSEVIGIVNQGAAIMNYLGHGGFDRFAAEGLLRTQDLPDLHNQDKTPIVTALTCNIGMFAVPGFASFGENLVLHDSGGAIAVWGPTGLSFNLQAAGMGDFLLGALASGDLRVLGDAIRSALVGFVEGGGDPNLLRVYSLLGDPGLVIR